ncbi:MAG: cytochrome C [Pseudomonadota bacterium]
MKKRYQSGLLVTSLTAAALLVASSHAQAYSHNGVTLRDASGAAIAAPGGVVPAVAPAYSAERTCGAAGCHDYKAIERHSFHAQLGANQHMGWNPYKNGTWNSEAANGKPWVQSPGHTGKW